MLGLPQTRVLEQEERYFSNYNFAVLCQGPCLVKLDDYCFLVGFPANLGPKRPAKVQNLTQFVFPFAPVVDSDTSLLVEKQIIFKDAEVP